MSCEGIDRVAPPKLNFTLKTQSDFNEKPHDRYDEEIRSQPPTDILLITANDNEFNACYSYMKQIRRGFYTELGYVDFGQFGDGDDQNVQVALMKCRQGSSDTQTVATIGARILNPKVVLFVGICATMRPDKAKLGDVVLSDKLATYTHREIRPDGTVEYHGVKTEVSRNMAKLFLHAADGWKPPLKDPKSLKVEVHRDAVMLSGPDLVNCRERRQELSDHFRDALGLEMEGEGLYKAAHDLGLEWGVIKAVSNFADGSKEVTKNWQPFSSAMAASVVYNIFKHPVVLKDWYRHKETKDAQGPTNKASATNCDELEHSYWPRKKLDDEIQKIQKGKIKVLHGTIGTGKTSAARHYIDVNKQKFAIRWRIDVSTSTGKYSAIASLTQLAEELGVSYRKLFQTIRQRAERQEDIIFLLDNVQKKPCDEWFRELWNIRSSVYIIITTNIAFLHFDLPDAEELRVEEFDEALEFLNEIHDDDGEDLLKLCKQFGWNILGLRVARDYMLQNKITARAYLKSMRVSETVRKNQGDSSGHPALYHSIRACLEEVDPDKFLAIATTSFISNNMIPVFLLSNQLSASNPSENEARLDAIHAQLKSLVQITNENENRFFSYHSFTQYVIEDMIKENKSVKSDLQHLPCRLAGIFVRYISKDNRFSKSHFLQRNVCEHVEVFLREHAKVYLKELEDKQNDDPTNNESRKMIALITFARLSELLGFTYTQQQPLIRDELDHHFERATYLLHKLCGITEKDLQPVDESDNENLQEMFGITDEDRVMFGITNNDFAVAHQLSTKLTKKSSELSSSLIELVFWRTVNEQDLAMFPEEVKENETVREKIRSSEPLSRSDVEELVKHGVAYSVDRYRELFLPELYLSVIYSFGRNYFYRDRTTLKHPRVYYIDLLKRAYCLSRAISKKMNRGEAVLHEFMVQANGLLYLLVNHDCQDGTHKEEQVHAEDLNNAICYYQKLINEERRFFEMGMLKRTKDDTTSKLKCYQQIIKCYKILLKINEDRGRCIKDGAQTCEDLFELLTPYGAQNVDRTNEHLVQYSRHMNAIAEFYLSTNNEEYFPRATEIFTLSAEQAEKYDVTIKFYLEALVGLADVCSRIGKHQDSICHLKQCDSKESLRKLQRQNPPIQERICNIHRRNDVTSPRGHERDEAITSQYCDDTDAVRADGSSSYSIKNENT